MLDFLWPHILLILWPPTITYIYIRLRIYQQDHPTRTPAQHHADALERSTAIVPTRIINEIAHDHMRKWDQEFWASLGGGTLPPYGPHRHELTPDPYNGGGIPSQPFGRPSPYFPTLNSPRYEDLMAADDWVSYLHRHPVPPTRDALQDLKLEFQEFRAQSLRKPPDPHPLLSKSNLIDDHNAAKLLALAREELAKSRKTKPEDC